VQIGDRLDIRKARCGDFAGAHPITSCLFKQPRLGQMICQDFRLRLDEVREGPAPTPPAAIFNVRRAMTDDASTPRDQAETPKCNHGFLGIIRSPTHVRQLSTLVNSR
jgi:hypothetical protein